MQLNIRLIKNILDKSLQEDFGINGDITSSSVIDDNQSVNFKINAREDIIISGTDIAKYYLDEYSQINYRILKTDSQEVNKGDVIIEGSGSAKEILLLERIILNYMQHLSGIATLTNKFASQIKGTKAKIADTRKTTPGLRSLQKYAVRCGGGVNHRLCLDSGIMIKDNHIAICGSIKKALKLAKANNPHYAKIEIECDTLQQVDEALSAGADIIMLDNMSIEEMQEAVVLIKNRAIIEASGNISLENVKQIAQTGVDIISVGKITHSAPSVDIGLDI